MTTATPVAYYRVLVTRGRRPKLYRNYASRREACAAVARLERLGVPARVEQIPMRTDTEAPHAE